MKLLFEVLNINYVITQLTSIGVRGNGLGLSWDKSEELVPAEDQGIWTFDVNYQTDFKGSYCQECGLDDQGFIVKGTAFRFAFKVKL